MNDDFNRNCNLGAPIYTRRQMLELMAKTGAGTVATLIGLQSLKWFTPCAMAAQTGKKPNTTPRFTRSPKNAMFYSKSGNGNVICELCPRAATILQGSGCFCKTRRNIKGELYAMGFDKPCIVNFEPIERGPAFHFHPGTTTMAMGAAGCNLNCLYCQNYELAQAFPEEVRVIDLNEQKAISEGKATSLTITYTEPACQPEYILDLAKLARSFKWPVLVCTAGYINQKPLETIIPHVDAFVVTLKAATDDAYLRLTEVHMQPVLESIKTIKKSGKWLEIVTLIVPGYNDDRKGIETISKWIADNVGNEVPWHISRFTPQYQLKNLPPTPRKTIEEAREVGINAGLKYVYATNLAPHDGNHTYCPSCKEKIVERLGFKTMNMHIKDGKCVFCGKKIPGFWN